ncbi:MAG TPA: nuclear transport factor 2 family protein [Steroidobacteraceae bacterium]|nr:nuclear transport factor 2 family protein [Steroidobacteraceae bacterium]
MSVERLARAVLAGALLIAGNPSALAAPSAQPIIDNERAFAHAAVERGTRAAFLEVLAESSVRLDPAPHPGRAVTEAGPSPGAPLRWQPDLASISGSGDFGWASGPWLAYEHSTEELPVAAGHYLTVWRKEPGGAWRVLLDGGVAYPLDEPKIAHRLEVTPRLRHAGGGHGRASDCSGAFATLWQQKGRAAALKQFLADDARQLVAGAALIDGRSGWLKGDTLRGAVLSKLRTSRSLRSDGGDIEVSYGELDVAARLDTPARHYVFVHNWDVGKSCRLALEMLNPAR